MKKTDLLLAMNEINDEYIEASEQRPAAKFKAKASVILAAALMLALSVTALGAAGFFNTVSSGKLAFMEAVGEYTGDVYEIRFDVDVAKDAEYVIEDYCVPMYLEKNWVDCGGEASPYANVMAYDNYEENWFAIFYQYPAWNYDNGGAIGISVPAGTEFYETVFEIDGQEIYCIESSPCDDGYTGDPFGTRRLFWSDGYSFFVLETRLTMDDEILREILRSVEKVDDISQYVPYEETWD